ncbi:MAG: SDR family NAD(P)-dependent oxidoreductase [Ruminococcaceae bacterium]|nr:SDR family NAD(P)-dependent oxidoreductase [Oscillospiraceae bacterium]
MKIAVFTGASSGMGREFVRQIVREEKFDEIWVIARRVDRLESLKNEVDVPVRCLGLDLTRPESIESYKALLEELKPEVKVLVNASGYGKFGAFLDLGLEEQLGMVDLNSKALVAVTYVTAPYLGKGSKVYQVDSLSSFQPVPYIGVYGATKAFVLSFTRAVNAEWRHTGIKMMAVCPGWVKTEFFDTAVVDESVITYYNQFFTSEQVVKRALRDMKKGKDVSVCGWKIRAQVLLTKLLPHKLVMKIWLKQQNKK